MKRKIRIIRFYTKKNVAIFMDFKLEKSVVSEKLTFMIVSMALLIKLAEERQLQMQAIFSTPKILTIFGLVTRNYQLKSRKL